MADILNRSTKEFLRGVDESEYNGVDWIINPNLSDVKNIRKKYWKIIGNSVVEMNSAEKEIVDTAEKAEIFNNLNPKIGDVVSYSFTDNGLNIRNRWLTYMGNDRSNKNPAIVTYKSKLQSVYFSNATDNILIQIQIHGMTDGDSLLKYSLYAMNRSFNKIMTDNIIFEQGEKVAIFLKDANGENITFPSNVTLRLDMQVIDVNKADIIYNSMGVFNYV